MLHRAGSRAALALRVRVPALAPASHAPALPPLALPASRPLSAAAAPPRVVAPPEGESHDDFKPKPRQAAPAGAAAPDSAAIFARIEKVRSAARRWW